MAIKMRVEERISENLQRQERKKQTTRSALSLFSLTQYATAKSYGTHNSL